MKRYTKAIIVSFTLALGMLAGPVINETEAQCPMCKIAAESNLENGGTAGKGLNAGILYMLATPYLLVAGIGLMWYRNRRKEGEEEVEA